MKEVVGDKIAFIIVLEKKMALLREFYNDEGELPANLLQFMKKITFIHDNGVYEWSQLVEAYEELNWQKTNYSFKKATIVIKVLHIILSMVHQSQK